MKHLFFSSLVHLSRRGYCIFLVAALFVVALVWGTFSFTSTAHAASFVPNSPGSKQLKIVYMGPILHPLSVMITGANQNGKPVAQCFNTPTLMNYDTGHWWKGLVSLSLFRNKGCTNFTGVRVRVVIPAGLPGNWYPVVIRWLLPIPVA